MNTLYRRQSGDKIQCILCPHNCIIAEGRTGICGVRKNNGGRIELLTYGVISGYALDPIEKKPLYHFFPGTNILSIGSYGCNMRCDFCQNYHISQRVASGFTPVTGAEKIISDAQVSLNNIGIAFTYNEPVIWFEYVRDVATRARNKGLKTVMVSNGYVNPGPLEEIISFTDAFNIDLKAFTNAGYRRLTGAGLKPVRESLKMIAKSGRHLEITTLIIPGQNDSEDEIDEEARWIAGELGKDIPLHLSRYFPMYKREDPATTGAAIMHLAEIASGSLDYVYTGNIASGSFQDTRCPVCNKTVTRRTGYSLKLINLDRFGNCASCGTGIYRHFTYFPRSAQN
ncbi:MAG TPA: AmmeMemoRadiSam system radical SAM enzyme [Bacteroidales bacterium]|jgi:pyruvate formate lyase activating enzyme|nr:AmmeMemoRadiSam system radical SAM enzyme [Bacteroidales bacterium]HQH23468.1 AmmeMemoRadiSam system radical SAM enzyme [Bacteroidales bacterium]HQJ82044.1 AmmeMemoRadiSam system radical SAM enzyme [Bacteroidales bacterium]